MEILTLRFELIQVPQMYIRVVRVVVIVIVIVAIRSSGMRVGRLSVMAVGWRRGFIPLILVLAHGTA